MAYLVRRPGGLVQIRESVRTERGPRSRRLASFRGALSDRVLDEAAGRATGRLDREALIAKARALGLPWSSTTNQAARHLMGRLRRGRPLDSSLVSLLLEQLGELGSAEIPEDLDEAADWLGASEAERSEALLGVLRLGDAIARSRQGGPRARKPYPQLRSAPAESV